ncbi:MULTISPECIES: chaplin family protein [Streptomyces]|uniref:Chaplin family protein n=1 Tax=Streptomyces edwardsiae TaxID=3075527 RepID=A0ABU2QH27_9ACTN|nr:MULTISPECIES: chaplin family protein [unclassified Streptomyces]MDT0403779.1 chaplin family protein [Streptomyces sp. DSM 41635]
MRQTLSRGVFVAAAAATGILSLYGTPALADSFAAGGAEDSPGVLSGNNVQAPVHVPVNACGNSVNVVGAFNEASDNTCVNADSGGRHADGAQAVGGTEGSPGVLSGNNVQAPVHVPVNACGNTVNGAAAFNEASDNTCVNGSHDGADSSHAKSGYGDSSTAGTSEAGYGDSGGAQAVGAAKGSPGVLSGNNVQVPVHVPVNACGNSVDVLALFNSAYDNTCVNDSGYGEDEPEKETPVPPTHVKTPPKHEVEPPAEEEVPGNPPHLAETGTDGLIAASAAGAVLIAGGAMIYRRGRVGAR